MPNPVHEQQQKLHRLLTEFDTGMLVTHGGPNHLHGRPMAVAQVEDNCDLWFITSMEMPKVDEIRHHSDVLITFQDRQNQYVTINGQARVVRDADKIDELWQPPFKIWFPDGKSDPNLTLIHVETQQGEYWDHSGLNQVLFALEVRSAYTQHRRPHVHEGKQHGHLKPF